MAKENKSELFEKGSKFTFPKAYFVGTDISGVLEFLNAGSEYVIDPQEYVTDENETEMEFLGVVEEGSEEDRFDFLPSKNVRQNDISDENGINLGFNDAEDINPYIKDPKAEGGIPIIDVPVNIRPNRSLEITKERRMYGGLPAVNGVTPDERELRRIMESGGFFGIPNITLSPQNITIQPQTVTMNPQTVTMNPQTVTMNPEVVTMNPQNVTMNPQTVTMNPETVVMQPQTVNIQPDVVNIKPEAINIIGNESVTVSKEAVTLSEAEAALLSVDEGFLLNEAGQGDTVAAEEGSAEAVSGMQGDKEDNVQAEKAEEAEEEERSGGVELRTRVVGVMRPGSTVFYDPHTESKAKKAGIDYTPQQNTLPGGGSAEEKSKEAAAASDEKTETERKAATNEREKDEENLSEIRRADTERDMETYRRQVFKTANDPVIEEFGASVDASEYRKADKKSGGFFGRIAERLRRRFDKKSGRSVSSESGQNIVVQPEKSVFHTGSVKGISDLTSVYDYFKK